LTTLLPKARTKSSCSQCLGWCSPLGDNRLQVAFSLSECHLIPITLLRPSGSQRFTTLLRLVLAALQIGLKAGIIGSQDRLIMHLLSLR
jgi:hypothetical protein